MRCPTERLFQHGRLLSQNFTRAIRGIASCCSTPDPARACQRNVSITEVVLVLPTRSRRNTTGFDACRVVPVDLAVYRSNLDKTVSRVCNPTDATDLRRSSYCVLVHCAMFILITPCCSPHPLDHPHQIIATTCRNTKRPKHLPSQTAN